MSRKRALIAGLLSVVYPGVGHLYLREFVRAFAWFGVAFLTALFVVPESAVTAFENGGVSAFLEASRDLPSGAFLALFMVRALNVIDAVRLGLRSEMEPEPPEVEPEEGASCPHCGKELDEDLAFCPWCSTRLEPETGPEGEAPASEGEGRFG